MPQADPVTAKETVRLLDPNTGVGRRVYAGTDVPPDLVPAYLDYEKNGPPTPPEADSYDDLSKKTVEELKQIAKERGVSLADGANKTAILKALSETSAQ